MLSTPGLILGIAALALVGCEGAQRPSNEGQPAAVEADLQDAVEFETIADVARLPDVGIRGTVVSVEPGRYEHEGQGHLEVRYRAVTIRVDSVLFGNGPSEIVLEEMGWSAGKPVAIRDYPATEEGQEAFFFLTKKDGLEAYSLTNYAQSRYIIQDSRLVGPDRDDSLVQTIEQLSPDEFATRVSSVGSS
jgi:hypothetical protein